MTPTRSRPARSGCLAWIGVAALLVAFAAVNARWFLLYRAGQVYDIDESGYLTYALADFRELASGGIVGWVRQIEAPSYQAPLTTLLTSLVFTVTGASPAFGFVTTTACGLATIALGFAVGCELGGRRLGLLGAVLVACNPAILNAVRAYNFAMPAAALLSLAVLAMLRSQGFRRIGWTVAFGVVTGLLPLARTVTIAFLPALGAAALLLALLSGRPGRSLASLVLAGCIALAVMATWLLPNGRYVADYLMQFGYGARAAVYDPGVGPGLVGQVVFMVQYLGAYTFLPDLLYILVGVALEVVLLVAGLVAGGRGVAARDETAVPHRRLAVLVVALGGLAALMMSRNKGAAFATPLVPLLLLLATLGFLDACRFRGGTALASLVALGAAAWPAATMADLAARVAWPVTVDLPVLGTTIVSNGIGPSQHYEQIAGYASSVPTMPLSAAEGRQWMEALRRTAQTVAGAGGERTVTVFGARGYLFNINEVNFAWMFAGHSELPLLQITPEVLGDDADAYAAYLATGEGARACLLVTAAGTIGQIMPPITEARAVAAARRTGFEPGAVWTLPDGWRVMLWSRRQAAAPCPDH